jgi:hypothetical protein
VRETISTEGADLAIGESMMTTCPFCNAPEEKFAITRYEDGLGYRCFRASCDESGAVNAGPFADVHVGSAPRVSRFEPKPYTGELTSPAIDDFAGRLMSRIGLSVKAAEERYGIKSIWGGRGIYYPLQDRTGRQIGWQCRTEAKRVWQEKLLDTTLHGVYESVDNGMSNLWIVEDPLSAIRLAEEDKDALALLGTSLAAGIDIPGFYDTVYVALDPGAEESARKIMRYLRSERGINAVMVVLPDDIHRLDPATFSTLLETYS